MPVATDEFRSALRHFPAGVTIVTTRDGEGRPCGLTASALTSVSLDPPLVLVCVDHAATAHPAVEAHGWFAVNVLGKSQEHLARRFAVSGSDKFAGVAFREGRAGLPILEDVVASLECRVVHRYAGGDHTIFVGQVEGVAVAGGPPLVYFQGGYYHLE
ncbi:MAG: flavin reductase family protein [Candidatus Rokubacteria bacterium]|nr:flavin reductase family protein [Candidatus Rokubacteria bacterium]